MMKETEIEDNLEEINNLKEILNEFRIKRNSTVLLFFSNGEINYNKALDILKIIRREPPIHDLDLIIDSGGGDIDMAVKIVEICAHYSEKFTLIVPFLAKSATTIIALSTDDLILGKVGELGPIDPQVKHPTLDMYFPASSIKNALEFIESSNDPDISISMADIFGVNDVKQIASEIGKN